MSQVFGCVTVCDALVTHTGIVHHQVEFVQESRTHGNSCSRETRTRRHVAIPLSQPLSRASDLSTAPDGMAVEFLNELAKVFGMEYVGE